MKNDPVLLSHRKWQEQVDKQKKEIPDYQLRQKFLTELLASGAVVDTSEIVATLAEIRQMLFSNRGWGRKGPAHSWVSYKVRLSADTLRSFAKKYDALFSRTETANVLATETLTRTERADLCSQAEQTRNTWYAADLHARAAREYCMTFDSTINREDFGRLQKSCFGSSNSTVPAQIGRVGERRGQAEQINEFMRQLGCRKPEILPIAF